MVEEYGAASGPMSSDHLLAFVHIPKTAGATVKGMLANVYSRQALHDAGNFFGKDPERTARKVAGALRPRRRDTEQRGRVTVGHVPYGLYREHLPQGTRYITLLRDPIARVRSHYNRHFRPNRADGGREGGGTKFASLELGLAAGEPRLTNLQTRLLCGSPSPLGDLSVAAVDDAKANLSDFFFVGITERFDESAALLQRRLGVNSVPYGARHVNPRPAPPDDDPERQGALIAKHNKLDLELYAFALELFEEALAEAGEGLAAEAENLRGLGAAADEEARRETEETCQWLKRELPIGATRPIAEIRAAAAAAGITKGSLERAGRLLEVEKREGVSWVRTPVTVETAREWLERELPVGATRSLVELRAAAAESGIERRKLGRAAQLVGAELVADLDGQDALRRPGRGGKGSPAGPARKRARRSPEERERRAQGRKSRRRRETTPARR